MNVFITNKNYEVKDKVINSLFNSCYKKNIYIANEFCEKHEILFKSIFYKHYWENRLKGHCSILSFMLSVIFVIFK